MKGFWTIPDMKDIANMDERKASIRLKDPLTMRSGTDYHERTPDAPHGRASSSSPPCSRTALGCAPTNTPSVISSTPLGSIVFWLKNGEGHAHGNDLPVCIILRAKYMCQLAKNRP